MKKVVYVTGCLGFIGSYVTRACLHKGWYVKGVDKMTYASNEELLEEFQSYDNFSFIKSDINDLKFLYECDYIINTAAETHVGNSIANSDEFIRSNVNGVHNLLELIKNYRQESAKKPIFLHFSTDEVYGDIRQGSHVESDLLKPSNPYSATKAAADMLILAWARTFNLPYIIVRPTNNYGIGQYVEKLIPKTCKYLTVGRQVELHDGGLPVRTWLHAEDTARAVLAIIDAGVQNEIYNISGNLEITNLSVVQKIIREFNGDKDCSKYLKDMVRQGQDQRYSINDDKLRALGWEPTAKFDKELAKIVKYYKENFIW